VSNESSKPNIWINVDFPTPDLPIIEYILPVLKLYVRLLSTLFVLPSLLYDLDKLFIIIINI